MEEVNSLVIRGELIHRVGLPRRSVPESDDVISEWAIHRLTKEFIALLLQVPTTVGFGVIHSLVRNSWELECWFVQALALLWDVDFQCLDYGYVGWQSTTGCCTCWSLCGPVPHQVYCNTERGQVSGDREEVSVSHGKALVFPSYLTLSILACFFSWARQTLLCP